MKNHYNTRSHQKQALANAMRFLRLKYNVKRQWLANEIGLSVAGYEKVEQGLTQLRFTDAVTFCKALGTTVDELMEHYQREMNTLRKA